MVEIRVMTMIHAVQCLSWPSQRRFLQSVGRPSARLAHLAAPVSYQGLWRQRKGTSKLKQLQEALRWSDGIVVSLPGACTQLLHLM